MKHSSFLTWFAAVLFVLSIHFCIMACGVFLFSAINHIIRDGSRNILGEKKGREREGLGILVAPYPFPIVRPGLTSPISMV